VLTDLDEEIGGQTVGDMLLEPTVIYVKAIRELLESDVDVRGLAHITGDGFLNLLRLEAHAGYRIDAPLDVPPVFVHIAERGGVDDAELYEVFNMGCGFCVVVPRDDVDATLELLEPHHPGSAVIGQTTTATGVVELPKQGLVGRRGEGFSAGS
jgi:phosphoribosylformylglycinamidine cyclo-ligase